jgi:tagatose 6-phosphate kinase
MILCIGTTPTVQRTMVFDRFETDEVNRAAEVYEYASGKAVNVGRVLGALGARAMVVGFAGGTRGRFLAEDLEAAGVQTQFATVEAQTRLCTTILDRSAGATTELVEEAGAVTDAQCAHLEEIIDLWLGAANDAASDVMVFSGTLAPGVPADFISRWISRGPRVIVDAKGEPLRLAIERGGECVVKVNRQELAQTIGADLHGEREVVEAAKRTCPRDGWVIVTMGRDGLIGYDGSDVWRVRGPELKAVNPIGSGDAVAAGVAAGISWGLPFGQVLRLGAACGMANALTLLAGQVRTDDVEQLRGAIEVARVG